MFTSFFLMRCSSRSSGPSKCSSLTGIGVGRRFEVVVLVVTGSSVRRSSPRPAPAPSSACATTRARARALERGSPRAARAGASTARAARESARDARSAPPRAWSSPRRRRPCRRGIAPSDRRPPPCSGLNASWYMKTGLPSTVPGMSARTRFGIRVHLHAPSSSPSSALSERSMVLP